ncbi:thiosulfate sulfurtransferase/rhodanese-like domain-containing protein 3 isoform X2 [Paramacrobiotus metropolitanus]|nr:thiosulfate sulfurtransferase/rhodanese-like domain-containing protein 3 isoform X2 [Paramacrobiotus metropolitanus]
MMIKGNLGVIIDVRNPDEVRGPQGRIKGSINIPLSDIPEALRMPIKDFVKKYEIQNLTDKNDEIVFHCKAGVRSEQACKIAKSLGFVNAKNYKGSMDDYFEKETSGQVDPLKYYPLRPLA